MNDYYVSTAYRSDRLPDQTASRERPWLKRFSCIRLPWGEPKIWLPQAFLKKLHPKSYVVLKPAKKSGRNNSWRALMCLPPMSMWTFMIGMTMNASDLPYGPNARTFGFICWGEVVSVLLAIYSIIDTDLFLSLERYKQIMERTRINSSLLFRLYGLESPYSAGP